MKILCDQDEVLCQWGQRILEYYNEDRRNEIAAHNAAIAENRQMYTDGLRDSWTNLTLDDINEWDFKMSMGHGSEVYIRSYMRSNGFYENLLPMPGALEGMRNLIAAGHEIMIATAVPKCAPNAYAGKVEWLRRNLPELSLDRMTAIKEKHWLDGDVLIDDGLHNIDKFWEKGGNVILMDRPWNQNVNPKMQVSDRFWRAQGWLGVDGVVSCVNHLLADRLRNNKDA